MPIYEYECETCNKVIEKIQNVTAGNTIKCPQCKSICKRLISKSTFKLVGEGFYVNDYPSSAEIKTKDKKGD